MIHLKNKLPLIVMLILFAVPMIIAHIVYSKPYKYLQFNYNGELQQPPHIVNYSNIKDLNGESFLNEQHKKWLFVLLNPKTENDNHVDLLHRYSIATKKYNHHIKFATAEHEVNAYNAALVDPDGFLVMTYDLDKTDAKLVLKDIKRIIRNLYAS